jgi:BlaI family penicillinase repressor
MGNTKKARGLGRAEQLVLEQLWAHGPISAEDCRARLKTAWPMKESTLRTVLRRLEAKGYASHEQEGRAFLYRALEPKGSVATRAARQIIDRFWNGSAEELVIGLVDHAVLTPKQLDRLAKLIAERKAKK